MDPGEMAILRRETIGRGRIRTFEGISHQIYSLTRLATSVHARLASRGILGGRANVSMAMEGHGSAGGAMNASCQDAKKSPLYHPLSDLGVLAFDHFRQELLETGA